MAMDDSFKNPKTLIQGLSAMGAMLFTFLISSCEEKTETGPQKMLELEIMPSYTTDDRDNWIIITNSAGDLVTSSSFESGQTIELIGERSLVNDFITVTHLTFIATTGVDGRDFYFFNTYTDIPVGDKWYLKRSAPLPDEDAGSVTLNLTNLPVEEYDIAISSFNRRNDVTGTTDGVTANLDVGLRKSPTDLFLSVTGNDPRYKKIDAATDGEVFNFDFENDFQVFDHVIPIPFSSLNFFGVIQGFNTPLASTQGTNKNFHDQASYSGNTDQIKVGFNDGYAFYITNWSATLSNGSRVGYYKLGEAPTETSFDPIDDINFTMLNTTINGISFTASPEFEYCLNDWISIDDFSDRFPIINWQIARPAISQGPVLKSIPEEIVTQYPYLGAVFQMMSYRRSTFVKNVSETTYENYIMDQLRTNSFELQPREWFSVSK